MANNTRNSSADKASTFAEFVELQEQDKMTYKNFCILRTINKVTYTDQCILDYYITEFRKTCLKVNEFTNEEKIRYKYAPDLLAYDVYGSTQLDFVIMLCNGIIDPKEFDFKHGYIYLPMVETLSEFLSEAYSSESRWLNMNRNGEA